MQIHLWSFSFITQTSSPVLYVPVGGPDPDDTLDLGGRLPDFYP
jgi:hypothetical protein